MKVGLKHMVTTVFVNNLLNRHYSKLNHGQNLGKLNNIHLVVLQKPNMPMLYTSR